MAFVEVADAAERQQFETAAAPELHWLLREAPGGATLREAVAAAGLPSGAGYAFVAGEATMAAALREDLVVRGCDPAFVKAAGYWRLGEADFDDGHAH